MSVGFAGCDDSTNRPDLVQTMRRLALPVVLVTLISFPARTEVSIGSRLLA